MIRIGLRFRFNIWIDFCSFGQKGSKSGQKRPFWVIFRFTVFGHFWPFVEYSRVRGPKN